MRQQHKFRPMTFLTGILILALIALSGTWSNFAQFRASKVEPARAIYTALPESAIFVMPQENTTLVTRYACVAMTEMERREFASIISLEAGNQGAEGQQAVAEVILNRVISPDFPDSVHDVLHQGEGTSVPQFSAIKVVNHTEPGPAQYDAIDAALHGPSILPEDVVFFSQDGENNRIWGVIEDHVFCYGYVWE